MHDLLSKYLTGDISSEEKQTLFLLLKENTELKKKKQPIYKICRHLFLWSGEEHPASDMQYRSFVHLRKKRTFLFNMPRIAGYAAIMVFSVLSTYLLMTNIGRKRRRTCPLPGVFNPARSACQGIAGRRYGSLVECQFNIALSGTF